MSTTLALVGSVLDARGHLVLAAPDDLAPTNSADPNLNLTLWSGIAGFFTPLIVAMINQPRWSSTVRALLTVLVCLGVAAATTALEGQIDSKRLVTSVLLVLTAAIGTYHTLWRNVAPALEQATSPADPPA